MVHFWILRYLLNGFVFYHLSAVRYGVLGSLSWGYGACKLSRYVPEHMSMIFVACMRVPMEILISTLAIKTERCI